MKKKAFLICGGCLLLIAVMLFALRDRPLAARGAAADMQSGRELETAYYRVFDTYDTNGRYSFTQAMAEDDFLDRLKALNYDFHAAEDFVFFELAYQPLHFLGQYDGPNDFVVDYDVDPSMKNQELRIAQKSVLITPLYSVQLDQTAYELFGLSEQIVSGRGFAEADFLQADALPCLLGNNYLATYDLGALLEVEYLKKPMTLEVIGFFDDDAVLTQTTGGGELANYIVAPLLTCDEPQNQQDADFQKKLYDKKTWGFIIDQGLDYITMVEALGEKHSLPYTARRVSVPDIEAK